MPEVSTFKDLSVTFKKHPVTDDLVTVKDKAAVAQSIKGLLLTRRGERPFQPQLGSGLQDLLFEPLDYGSGALIKKEIVETLNRYEPRIQISNLECYPDVSNNGYEVLLEYLILGRDDEAVAIDIFLERTR
jgi:phage baseplate assembly protein W|tara:strand:+ start:1127 stop:1519 length:393 start_codon:yes stop_codon:yes gene_type:complete